MKPTAYLVNTSRGPIVDEAALLAALRERRIAGAGIDVYGIEPLPQDHPLRAMDNTVLTPHLGYRSLMTTWICRTYRIFGVELADDLEKRFPYLRGGCSARPNPVICG